MLANVKAEMARNDYTINFMANEMGMSENTFRFKLTEKREFTLSELSKLAQLLNCSIDYLVENRI